VLRYAGYLYDAHSRMYYLQRRYYDTATRSFISRDPGRADGLESPYQYCGGRPVAMVDPTGLFAHGGQTRNCGALRGRVQPWDPSPYHMAESWDPASAVYNNPTFQAGLSLLGESLTYGPPGTPTFAAHRWLQASHPTANAYVDVGANLAWCFVPGLGEVEAPYRGWKVYRAGRAGLEAYEAEKDIRAGIGAYKAARAGEAGLDLARGTRSVASARRAAVAQAWRDERAWVEATGRGSRAWTAPEMEELLATGRVSGYYGHHTNSVAWALDNAYDPMWWIENPSNVQFLNRTQHLEAHGYNWRTRTMGDLIDRGF
jgi:RHS repeat-associated protein